MLEKIVFEVEDEPCLTIENRSFLGYKGLSYRLSLPEDQAMLFDFKEEAFHQMTMEHVSFPLDIIFISSDLRVVDIKYGPPLLRGPISPNAYARYVVEANWRWCFKNEVEIGTTVRFQSLI